MISNDKILGVFVDQNLTWSDHIRHLSKRITSSIWLLSKVKKFLSQEHRNLFCKSYIQPHIGFCNIVWGSSSETNKQKILRLQKRACRVVLDYKVEDFSQAMDTLKILSIYDSLYQHITPDYISEQFTLRNNVNTSVNLRSATASCFIPPKPRTEYYKHSLRYSRYLVWNSLPDETKRTESLNTFHNRCITWLIK